MTPSAAKKSSAISAARARHVEPLGHGADQLLLVHGVSLKSGGRRISSRTTTRRKAAGAAAATL